MKQRIVFRADAGKNIGYGHFIRTLALADMLKDDFDCTFFTVNPTPYQQTEMDKVCRWEALNEVTALDDFIQLLCGEEIVVLDNYYYTTEYQQRVKEKGCKLVCIDDMHNKHYIADCIINHGLTDPTLFSCEAYTRLCLGFEFALLRSPFLNVKNQSGRENVVICFGGSDANDFTGQAINILLENTDKNIIAIIGDAYKPKGGLINQPRVSYRSRLSAQQMADAFSHASLAVCSASSVCIEAMACGAAVAAGWYVDNQQDFYEALVKDNHIIPLGNLNNGISAEALLVTAEQKTIDATSIKTHFLQVFHDLANGIYLRQVRCEDMDMIYQWANDPVVRACSFNSEPIPYENHVKWFTNLLTRKDVKMFVLIADGKPSGQCRLNIEGETAEIGYAISADSRGKGYGNTIIKLLEQEAATFYNIKRMKAKVKKENIPSLKVFERNSYLLENQWGGVITYCKSICCE